MRTKVIPRLLATMMQTEQAHPQIDVLHQDILDSFILLSFRNSISPLCCLRSIGPS